MRYPAPGLDPEAGADPALVRRERELREQVQRAAVAHHPGHVEIAKRVVPGERFVAPAIDPFSAKNFARSSGTVKRMRRLSPSSTTDETTPNVSTWP